MLGVMGGCLTAWAMCALTPSLRTSLHRVTCAELVAATFMVVITAPARAGLAIVLSDGYIGKTLE